MVNNTLLTPKELRSDLTFLKSRGFESSQLTRLHHFSRSGRTVSLAQVTTYFAERTSLRGNNIDFATRCHYVAEQIRAGRTNMKELVSEALSKWPHKRSAGPRKASKGESTTHLRSAAKRPKKRARARS